MAQLNPPVSHCRPASSYSYSHSNHALPSSAVSSGSEADHDDNSPLPFPAALSRADFLAPDFDAATYLSALHTGGPAGRHQTLEDLRSELRDRSAAISAELLELVNSNYTAFLSLGDELKGGEERVEDVRVALLGFRRAVEELQGRVRERRVEVGKRNRELREVKGAVELGRRMLELDERVAGLEGRLLVGSVGKGGKLDVDGKKAEEQEEEEEWREDLDSLESDEDEEEEAGDDVKFTSSSPSKLETLAREYVLVEKIAESVGRDLPFVKKMEERMARCRNTILLDLSTALREARKAGPKGQGRVLQYLEIYRVLDAQTEAVRVLRGK
ncbi:oligomeric golgi complex component, COG2-domain-containing protein [Chaetomium strumarium]|uniref:Conserved oligomeric Golgi complex subunit 2 n=1 Tax=Chaetomium strumarium TaxID=1170767 RepID=A0AAJ0M4A1_9PEZI|nr:oligomeric golgi complex component, COG2-domain-containing protein [Chaetomium strumarium]